MLRLSFDNETHAFSQACVTPPAVCLSYATIEPSIVGGYQVGSRDVLPYSRGNGVALDALHAWLTMAARADALLIGAHTAYDVFTSLCSAYQRSQTFGKELFGLFVKAYDANAVTDIFNRQKLIDLAAGIYRYDVQTRESFQYGLAGLARRHLGKHLDKENPWRIRFGELEDLQPAEYPREAFDYSLEDAVATAEVWIAQESGGRGSCNDKRIAENFPGMSPLLDEFNQARAALVLSDISNYGLRTHEKGVSEFEQEVKQKASEAQEQLVEWGLVKREYEKKPKVISKYIDEKKLGHLFKHATDGETYLQDNRVFADSGDPLLIQLADWRTLAKLLNKTPFGSDAYWQAREEAAELIERGLIGRGRNETAAAERLFIAYTNPKELGLDGDPRPVPRSNSWDPKKNPKHTEDSLECVKLDGDACDASEDPQLQLYSEYSSLVKALSTDIPLLRMGLYYPIHTRFEEILETGRTSSSKPNVQNIRRLPGIRECFIPRPRWVFIDTDYPSLELWTLGQTCKWVLGYSTLLDALNAGEDPHLKMACTILGRTYEDLKKHKKDAEVSNARTAGKGVNFGAPGGLGKATFAVYAYKSYGIRLTQDEAAKLIKQYKDTWTEMPQYFKWIESLKHWRAKKVRDKKGNEREERRHNVVQPWSGRLRGGASYCAAANSPFQGLGAEILKRALWFVFKACYGFSELGEQDPLFGCHMVNEVHDQIITEAPEARASAAAHRQAQLMDRASKEIMPDTNMKTEATLAAQWSKKVESWYEKVGGGRTNKVKEAVFDGDYPRLIPWEMMAACRDAKAKFEKMSDEERGAYLDKKGPPVPLTRESLLRCLKKDEWSSYAANDVLAEVA